MLVNAIKISPVQSAEDMLRNVQDTNDAIDFSLKKSVQIHVRKERTRICAHLLDDVEIDVTPGPWELKSPEWKNLAQDSSGSTLSWPIYGPFQGYCIGRQFMMEDCAGPTFMISFSNVQSGAFSTWCPLVTTRILQWTSPTSAPLLPSTNMAAEPLLYGLSPVKCSLHCQHYATCKHELHISHCLSHNSWAFQNFWKKSASRLSSARHMQLPLLPTTCNETNPSNILCTPPKNSVYPSKSYVPLHTFRWGCHSTWPTSSRP